MRLGKKWTWAVGLIALLVLTTMVFTACGGDETTTTSVAGSTDTTVAGSTTTAPPAEAQTLKIGMVLNFSFPLHVDWQKEMDALIPAINEAGGLDIGGQKYQIEMIMEDSKGNAETARAAVEKLVNQDKVKFILGDETVDGWLSVTEPAGVVVVANTPTPGILQPENKLAFNAGYFNTQAPIIWNWFTTNFPQVKSFSAAFIDAAQGHAEADKFTALAKAFGKEVAALEFYPDGTQDFSAIATKLVSTSPDAFTTQGGGPVSDSLLFKSLRTAGWAGQLFNTVPLSPPQIAKVISLDDVQGLVGAIAAIDSATPPPVAQELKDLYVAKYGEWTNADVGFISTFYCLKAALEKAGTIDPLKVAEVIGTGLTFETANGKATMINRPDLKNDRTIDAVYETMVGQIEGQVSKVLATISAADGEKAARILFSAGAAQ
jgi:branched-chain amino acid transport system substrate-binding protein